MPKRRKEINSADLDDAFPDIQGRELVLDLQAVKFELSPCYTVYVQDEYLGIVWKDSGKFYSLRDPQGTKMHERDSLYEALMALHLEQGSSVKLEEAQVRVQGAKQWEVIH